jgi:hypothetical protein
MKDTNRNAETQGNDRRLDIPGEANTEKHINFLELEEGSNRKSSNEVDDFAEERRRQWQEGIAEGKKAREEGNA